MSRLTKQAILEAFTELLKTKSVSKITIQDIADECHISRMTFYYHFKDIYDLIDWAVEEKLKKAVDNHFTYDTWLRGFTDVFRACMQDKAFYLKIFPTMDLRRIEVFLNIIARKYIVGVVEEKKQEMHIEVDPEDQRMICEVFGYTMVGLLLNWMLTGMKEDPELVVKRYGHMMRGTLEMALRRTSRPVAELAKNLPE